MVASPEAYRWSSFRRNGLGAEDTLVSEHPLYKALGRDAEARREAYRALFRAQLDEAIVADIRSATASGHLLASERFRKEAEAAIGARVALVAGERARKIADSGTINAVRSDSPRRGDPVPSSRRPPSIEMAVQPLQRTTL